MEAPGEIILKDCSQWYTLSWWEEQLSLLLRVDSDFAEGIGVIAEDDPRVADLMETSNFETFIGGFGDNFGFNDALGNSGQKDGCFEFIIPLPGRIKENCLSCEGTGTRGIPSKRCQRCNGTGKEMGVDYKRTRAISASLNLFFEIAWSPGQSTLSPLTQLMKIRSGTGESYFIGGEFGIDLCEWLAELGKNVYFPKLAPLPKVVQAMTAAYCHMQKTGVLDKYRFGAHIADQTGRVIMACPGDACQLSPDSSMGEDRGRRFGGNNIDSPVQQITFFVGLAVLCDMAREAGV